jgi:Ca2+ transporting ATPase
MMNIVGGQETKAMIVKRDVNKVDAIPFNSIRKMATLVIQHPEDNTKIRVFCKGAPEIVFKFCDKYMNEEGNAVELSEEKKAQITKDVITEQFAKNALRTILVTYVDYTVEEYNQLKEENNGFKTAEDRAAIENERNLTAVAIFALEDPLRDEIKGAIQKCHSAGITVRMVTGDNINTAKAIAIQAGIIKPSEVDLENVCMEGQEFNEKCGGLTKITVNGKEVEVIQDKQAFREIKNKLKVLARSTPEDKFTLVTGLRDEGSVVAVTGDGTNDAPALRRADVGFAMGIAGTDVAKEASEIVLLDDNFNSMVTAVKWGRNIYQNVRKFLQFQLTVNVVAMFIVFSGGVLFGDAPLTSVQMLWVNLIMDTFAALALATEPPHDSILNDKPYHRNELIVTAVMWRNIFGQSIFQITVLIVLLVTGQNILDITEFNGKACDWEEPLFFVENAETGELEGTCKALHYTIIFNAFVFM